MGFFISDRTLYLFLLPDISKLELFDSRRAYCFKEIFYNYKTYSEIAKELNISTTRVRQLVSKLCFDMQKKGIINMRCQRVKSTKQAYDELLKFLSLGGD